MDFNTITLTLFLLLISANAASYHRSETKNDSNYVVSSNTQRNFTFVCDPKRYSSMGLDVKSFVFCDSSLPYEVRARDLIKQMSLAEKVQQLGNTAYGVPRLGLPKYEWWSEALHGVSNLGPGTVFDHLIPGATSFPTVILSTASFNESLWKRIGQVVSTEARAMYNMGRSGLTFWSPNVNVVRDPRWGRITETPGEDPFVVGVYGANYVRGLQDVEGGKTYDNPNHRPLKVSSCCKHYAAYDVDNWKGVDRLYFDARVTEQDMKETFMPPFETCIRDGDVSSVMCSYNRVNGVPTCADSRLLKEIVRGEWGLNGYIVSDCDSIQVMVDDHKFLNDTNEDAVARTLKAGLDLDCGVYYTNFTANSVAQGKVQEKDIDTSLNYLYVVLMRLGYFDGLADYDNLGVNDICTKDNIDLATQAARQGIVLLKNINGALPFSNQIKKVAVVGPHSNATTAMIGNYAGIPCRYTSPIDGLSKYANITYEQGCDVACTNDSLIVNAVNAAKEADATIILAGLDLSVEAENLDRTNLLLPGFQRQLIERVSEVSRGPVVLVIMSAGGVDISFARDSPKIVSILWAGYPGEEGGQAIADVIFGKHNPGGRLPLTWHEASYVDKLPMTSMQLRPVDELGYPGRTYKFFNGSTVYPFGYGLSYTNFTYTLITRSSNVLNIKLNKFHHCHDLEYTNGYAKPMPCAAIAIDDLLDCSTLKIEFEVEVDNIGTKDGTEVVIVYSQPPKGIAKTHFKQVIGFNNVAVNAGGKQKVNFQIDACKALGIVDYRAYTVLPSGNHTIVIGDRGLSFPVVVNYFI